MAGLERLYCFFGRHTRSRGRARRMANGWRSYCRQCGVEMFKEEGGEWYVVPDTGDDKPDAAVPVADAQPADRAPTGHDG